MEKDSRRSSELRKYAVSGPEGTQKYARTEMAIVMIPSNTKMLRHACPIPRMGPALMKPLARSPPKPPASDAADTRMPMRNTSLIDINATLSFTGLGAMFGRTRLLWTGVEAREHQRQGR